MDAGSTHFHRELRKRLDEAVGAGDTVLTSGAGLSSFDDYRYRVGFQNALRQVVAITDEIAVEMDKRQ